MCMCVCVVPVSTYNLQHTMEHNISTGTNFIQYCCIFTSLHYVYPVITIVILKGTQWQQMFYYYIIY